MTLSFTTESVRVFTDEANALCLTINGQVSYLKSLCLLVGGPPVQTCFNVRFSWLCGGRRHSPILIAVLVSIYFHILSDKQVHLLMILELLYLTDAV